MQKIERDILSYIVNLGLALSFLVVFVTGIVKWPELTHLFRNLYRLIPARIVALLHDWAGIAIGLFVLIHLILHWKWIINTTKKVFGKKKDERKKL